MTETSLKITYIEGLATLCFVLDGRTFERKEIEFFKQYFPSEYRRQFIGMRSYGPYEQVAAAIRASARIYAELMPSMLIGGAAAHAISSERRTEFNNKRAKKTITPGNLAMIVAQSPAVRKARDTTDDLF